MHFFLEYISTALNRSIVYSLASASFVFETTFASFILQYFQLPENFPISTILDFLS